MSREQKISAKQLARMPPPSPPVKPPEEVTAQEKADVTTLLAKGESGPALEQAKRIHKRCHTASSEALLLEAYLARIPALAERGLEHEAKSLMQLVRERYPACRERLRGIAALFASGGQGLNDLLQPLNDPQLPAERRAPIFKAIRCRITDLGAIADCRALGSEHPLRTGAAVLVKALEAVTSGPVEDAALALPEISRQSPLAPWKMLVRAIAAFYRREDSLCEKYLAAIEADSAAAQLVPALRTLLGQPQQALSPAASNLVTAVGGTLDVLRSTLEKVDRLLDRKDQSESFRHIRNAVAECEKSCPEILERLKQHIGIRGVRSGFKTDRLTQAIGANPLTNAYFWRLLARSLEQTNYDPERVLLTCAVWEEFRRHAIHEKWFPEKGPEVAAVYLHMVDLLHRIHPADKTLACARFTLNFKGLSSYYAGQPPEIRALTPPAGKPDLYMIDPDRIFARVCAADPCSENFQRWLDWHKNSWKRAADHVAEKWLAHLPKDVKPALHLMTSAEKRGAFTTAFEYMCRAEMIDGLNPEVRKARFRLLVSMATRHLQKKKTKLAWPELNALAVLPETQHGDRVAYVAALNCVGCMILGRDEEVKKECSRIVEVFNSAVAARIVLRGAILACKFMAKVPELPLVNEGPLAAAAGRACAVGEDVGVPFDIPRELNQELMRDLAANGPGLDFAPLSALGEVALREQNLPLAYAVSTAGLAGAPAGHPHFLFLRAQALPRGLDERQDACVDAAAELARRQRNDSLLEKISRWRENVFGEFAPMSAELSMPNEEVNKVLQAERSKPNFPDGNSKPEQPCDCPDCRRAGKRMEKELAGLLDEFGPEVLSQALDDALENLGKASPGKRKSKAKLGS